MQLLLDQNSTASAWRVDAAFGVFGSLPMLGVTFDDAFVLLDATKGNLDGPFDLDSPLDAAALLSHHAAYSTGTTVRHVNDFGCVISTAATWNPTPPPCPNCPAPRPAWVPVPPPASSPPGTPPGRQTNWYCADVTTPTGTACKCTSTRWVWIVPAPPQYPPGQPSVVRERLTCSTPGFCGATTPAPPTGTAPCPWGVPGTDYWY